MTQTIKAGARSDTLDWYRGIGILAVLWGHAGLPGLPGAYLFIDTFFVISGYLVSLSLWRAIPETGGHRSRIVNPIRTFISARLRRILIPLAATVLLTLGAGWLVLLPDDLHALATSARATLLLQAHVYALGLGNYFDTVGAHAPLLHAWSLSLEEWFYLLTPFLILPAILWRKGPWLGILIVALSLSFLQAERLSSDPQALGASYYLFITRVWEFLLGAIAALLLRRGPNLSRSVNDTVLLAGFAGVFASVLIFTDKAPSPGLVTLPAVLGVVAILVLRPISPWLQRATRMRLASFFGRKLYSLYLAHYPVMVYLGYLGLDSGPGAAAAKFVAGLGCGLLLFYAVEAPFKGWREIRLSVVLAVSAALILPIILISGAALRTGGAPTRLPEKALAAWTSRFDVNPNREDCLTPQLTRFGYSCALGPRQGPFVALFGDSHSDAIANQLARILSSQSIGLRHYWYAECPTIGSGLDQLGVFSDTCTRLSHEAHRAALRDSGLVGVVYAARWPWYLNDPDPENLRAYWRAASGLPRRFADMNDYRRKLMEGLRKSVLDFTAQGVPVHVMTPVPSPGGDPVRERVLANWPGRDLWATPGEVPLKDALADRAAFDRVIAPLAEEGLITLLDGTAALCGETGCTTGGPVQSFYYDGNHLNEAGSSLLLRRFVQNHMLRVKLIGAR
ncbi:acyltransferase family protein [Cereibacter johrii]|uniref:acyltransferase family protein n=1 Tax=Cereibacter johrii TaxID=445629 RepID=UPI001F21FD49|nr:acyltransferase family protein [Cereibacter johrii]